MFLIWTGVWCISVREGDQQKSYPIQQKGFLVTKEVKNGKIEHKRRNSMIASEGKEGWGWREEILIKGRHKWRPSQSSHVPTFSPLPHSGSPASINLDFPNRQPSTPTTCSLAFKLSINLFRHTPWHIYDFWCSIHSITNPIYSYSFITNKPLKKTSERRQIIQILWLFSQSFKQKPVSHKI